MLSAAALARPLQLSRTGGATDDRNTLSLAHLETSDDAVWLFRVEEAINFTLLSPLNLGFAGFTFVLYGLAAALSDVYPRWLGWIVAVAGVGGAVSGAIQAYMGEPTAFSTVAGIAAPTVITLWLLVTGVLLVRRSTVNR